MPSYFQKNARKVDLLPADYDGFRNSQLGASAALISHATNANDEAVIVLPTGTGKTAVLQVTPYLWQARRTLVITPSKLVREQIADGFRELGLLKSLGILPNGLGCPSVHVVDGHLRTLADWNALKKSDVVVTTPMSASPSIKEIAQPPEQLFDLVLVDEAHHTPATSYAALMNAFPNARKALFTATPFRRDRKRLPGRIVYNYSLKQAIDDGTYGEVQFVPCNPTEGQSADIAIAKSIEDAFLSDRKAGLDHRVMVRTDSKARGKELAKLYSDKTKLRLQLVTGDHSLSHVQRVIKHLNAGDLDGIVCVDMFAEGVDFPRLKLAALHSPHKSLAVTLQFIGRFARTNADGIGTAKFFAVPQEINDEVQLLYQFGASWEDLVANLSDARIEQEQAIREGLASFEDDQRKSLEEVDLTVDAIRPYFHTKILKVNEPPDFDAAPMVPRDCELLLDSTSQVLNSRIVVYQRQTKPKWLEVEALVDRKNLFYLVHYHQKSGLLFINSVEHSNEVYDRIIESMYDEDIVALPLDHDMASRAWRMIQRPKFYNVGLRNGAPGSQDESYRTMTGSSADRNVNQTDISSRFRGHLFGGGESRENGSQKETLGVTASSKAWSNRYALIPEFIQWCERLAKEIEDARPVVTGSRIDQLSTGKTITELPNPVVAATWPMDVFTNMRTIRIGNDPAERDLTEFDLEVTSDPTGEHAYELNLVEDANIIATFGFDLNHSATCTQILGPVCRMESSMGEGTLARYFQVENPAVFLADFSQVVGNRFFKRQSTIRLDRKLIQVQSRFESDVDITKEFGSKTGNRLSVHDFTEQEFKAMKADVLIYDHRSGEVADYVAISEADDVVTCRLAHCKASGASKAGCRVDDAYEIAGQIVKCLHYGRQPALLSQKLVSRTSGNSKFITGSTPKLERIMRAAERKRFDFRICLVQPGISASKMNDQVSDVFAAASDYVQAHTGAPPMFWLSP